jgi:rubredoxin
VFFGVRRDPKVVLTRRRLYKRLLLVVGFTATVTGAIAGWHMLQATEGDEQPVPEVVGWLMFTSWLTCLLLLIFLAMWSNRPTRREDEAQLRFSHKGYAHRQGWGPVQWKPWRPMTKTAVRRRRRDGPGVLHVAVINRSRPPVDNAPDGFRANGLRAEALRRLLWSLHEQATGRRAYNTLDDIWDCPQCGYLLDVPRTLSRPGACPECGWRFDEETVVLYGWRGPRWQPGGRPRTISAIVADKILLLGSSIGFMLLAVGLSIVPMWAWSGLPPFWSQVVCGLIAVAGLVGGVWIVMQVASKAERERAEKEALAAEKERRIAPDQVRLSREGFVQGGSVNSRGTHWSGPLELSCWSGSRASLRFRRGSWHLRVEQRETSRRKLLRRYPVDFRFAMPRAEALRLRRLLTEWTRSGSVSC